MPLLVNMKIEMGSSRLSVLILALVLGACSGSGGLRSPEQPREVKAVSSEGEPATEREAPPAEDPAFLEEEFPIDPNVRIGTLDNGLRYYIRRNTEPRDRAELYLAVDAGSILEEEDQLGLAHFLEHMLFNGTRRFPNEKLIEFLESTGMRFGPDVNAYTSFDETVYTLTIPTDSAQIVEDAFDVLEDWAAYATLSDSMVQLERGVVIEEWRMSDQNAQGRIRDELIPVILHGSRYADRLPIGEPEIIRNAPPATVRAFYERWYRPDLMAVVAVGDFDPDRFESLIREHFETLPKPDAPLDRPSFEVPGHQETLYKVITDPEYPYASISIYYKGPAEQVNTVGDYREQLIGRLFNDLINARFDEIERRADAPFLNASVFKGAFVRTSQYFGASARVSEDSILTGISAILTETARVREHGFTETELERQKQEWLRAYRRAFAERENTRSSVFAEEYVRHFLEDEPIPGIELEYEIVQRLLPTISVLDINQLADQLLADANRAVVAILPEKEGLTPPTEDELRRVVEAVDAKEVEPYVDIVPDQPLVDRTPPPADVIDQRRLETIDVVEVTLENGVRLVMKPTDFKEDEVRMTAFSPGGSSLVDDQEAFEAEMSPHIVSRSGIGSFNRTELEKLLAGRVVSVSPYINELEEGFGATASPEDLETLMQLVYLYFTSPRADQDALASFQNQMRSNLINRAANPIAVWQDSLQAALYGNHIRRRVPTIDMVDALSIDDALQYYRHRFADASDFTFVFAGHFDVDSLTTLAQRYLGNLPAVGRDESWRDVAPDKPERIVRTTVHKGLGEQSAVALVFHGPMKFNREQRHRLRTLSDVLTIMLRRDLREGRGGVYSVGVNASPSGRPDETYTLTISFGCDPQRVEELTQAVFDQIESLKEDGPPADVVATVKEQQRRQRETEMRTNEFWTSVLEFYYSYDEDPMDVLTYYDLIAAVDAEDVQQAARELLAQDRYVHAVLFPEIAE